MLTERYNSALEYAAWLHRHQKRKGTETPYISHLVAVSMIALEYGASEDEAIAALLHDALEDGPEYNLGKLDSNHFHGMTEEKQLQEIKADIEQQFGSAVLEIVEGCTQSKDKAVDWYVRKQNYIDHIPHASASVALVSASDKNHNALCILKDYRQEGEKLWQRFNRGKKGVMFYYSGVSKAFLSRNPDDRLMPLFQQLAQTVSQLEIELSEFDKLDG